LDEITRSQAHFLSARSVLTWESLLAGEAGFVLPKKPALPKRAMSIGGAKPGRDAIGFARTYRTASLPFLTFSGISCPNRQQRNHTPKMQQGTALN
jgi:hypothetical protein